MDAILSIVALLSFALLVVAWLALPRPVADSQPVAPSRSLEGEPVGA